MHLHSIRCIFVTRKKAFSLFCSADTISLSLFFCFGAALICRPEHIDNRDRPDDISERSADDGKNIIYVDFLTHVAKAVCVCFVLYMQDNSSD